MEHVASQGAGNPNCQRGLAPLVITVGVAAFPEWQPAISG